MFCETWFRLGIISTPVHSHSHSFQASSWSMDECARLVDPVAINGFCDVFQQPHIFHMEKPSLSAAQITLATAVDEQVWICSFLYIKKIYVFYCLSKTARAQFPTFLPLLPSCIHLFYLSTHRWNHNTPTQCHRHGFNQLVTTWRWSCKFVFFSLCKQWLAAQQQRARALLSVVTVLATTSPNKSRQTSRELTNGHCFWSFIGLMKNKFLTYWLTSDNP